MPPSVIILATLDTKGQEAAFLRDRLRELKIAALLVDVSCIGAPQTTADVPREQVFIAAGTTHAEIAARNDRGVAIATAAQGAARLVKQWCDEGRVAGVLAIGGSAGTTIGTAAMRELPLGVPKVMVSTLASGEVRHYVGAKDILMLNAVVDIAGLNRVTRAVLDEAVRAMAGLVSLPRDIAGKNDRPLVAATMFGVTTPCVEAARQVLQEAGYEVLVFHATGAGGLAMESLINDGVFAGVLDITTTELADELVGGVLTAGPNRLTAAAQRGVPQVVSVGATDMVNFHAPETVPERFSGRKFYRHNPHVTLMRTTAEECARIGAEIGRKVSQSSGPACVLFPLRGVSAIDRQGQPFDDPAAREALRKGLRENLQGVEWEERDEHLNDPAFAQAAAQRLLAMMAQVASRGPRLP